MSATKVAVSDPASHELPIRDSGTSATNRPGSDAQAATSEIATSSVAPSARATHITSGKRSPPAARDESRNAYRKRSIEVITEVNGDVQAFLEELEVKRRHLDDQIHRYVKQREREFRLFEKDLRQKYRPRNAVRDSMAVAESAASDAHGLGPRRQETTVPVTVVDEQRTDVKQSLPSERQPTAMDLDSDAKANPERAPTPPALLRPGHTPTVDDKDDQSGRSPSAPARLSLTQSDAPPEPIAMLRANSDSLLAITADESKRSRLMKRTSSSPSQPQKSLASALRSSSSRARLPRRKRVSLVVGDEIVTPSDELDGATEAGDVVSQPGFANARRMSDDAGASGMSAENTVQTFGDKQLPPVSPPFARRGSGIATSFETSEQVPGDLAAASAPTADVAGSGLDSPFAMDEDSDSETTSAKYNGDDGDKLDDDDSDKDDDQKDADDHENDPSPLPSPSRSLPIARSPGTPSRAFPTPSFGSLRASSMSSSQPATAGYSLPAAKEDPTFNYLTGDFQDPEVEENQTYGSYSRSGGSSFLDRTGSLGESYMQKHAEEMMRRRRSSASNSIPE